MTRYRCCACGRRLTVPGLAIGDGRTLGPICAEKPENLPTMPHVKGTTQIASFALAFLCLLEK